ncbi:platelet glycoprotein VI-like isoform X2 [Phascolarctos cinereus]
MGGGKDRPTTSLRPSAPPPAQSSHGSLTPQFRNIPGSLAALLCLGLCLSQGVMAQKEAFPKPSLWAVPGTVIPWGKSVIVRCHGAEEAQRFLLEKDGSTELKDMLEVPGPWKEAEFFISDIAAQTAGLYPKPSILANPGSTVTIGQDVTLHCESQLRSDRYVLYKTTGANAPHSLLSTDYKADFLFPTVMVSHSGTYLCYSFDSDFPYLWSTPRDTLVLKISEFMSAHRNFISFRLILAGVTLAILGALMNEAWRHRGSAQQQVKKPLDEQPER